MKKILVFTTFILASFAIGVTNKDQLSTQEDVLSGSGRCIVKGCGCSGFKVTNHPNKCGNCGHVYGFHE